MRNPRNTDNNNRRITGQRTTTSRKPSATRARTNRRSNRRRNLRRGKVDVTSGARSRLRQFRQASILAVAITSLLLLFLSPQEQLAQGTADTLQNIPDTVSVIQHYPTDDIVEGRGEVEEESPPTPADTADEALDNLRSLWRGLLSSLPLVILSVIVIFLTWGIAKLLGPLIKKVLGRWEKSNAVSAITRIFIWFLGISIVISILAGDIRAIIGSLGLVGLALSWALQTPIESFTGWLMNSFQGYYRVGDRVSVGDVFGDVYKIDFLTTTVWEIGAPYRDGFVLAEQPTGRLVTFPNNEVLSGSVINLTRDFPYVWDELAVQVANESDLMYTTKVFRGIADRVLSKSMEGPALQYEGILRRAGLETHVPAKPQVFYSMTDSWTDVIIRYLVNARERRIWKSDMVKHLTIEMNKKQHANKIISVYPRRQFQFVDENGYPLDLIGEFKNGKGNSNKGTIQEPRAKEEDATEPANEAVAPKKKKRKRPKPRNGNRDENKPDKPSGENREI